MAHTDNLDLIRELDCELGMTMTLASGWKIIFPKNSASRGLYAVMYRNYPLGEGKSTDMTTSIDFDEAEQVATVTLFFPYLGKVHRSEATYKVSTFSEAVRKTHLEANRLHIKACREYVEDWSKQS